MSTLTADFEEENTKVKKENVQPIATQIIIAKKKNRLDVLILLSALYIRRDRLVIFSKLKVQTFVGISMIKVLATPSPLFAKILPKTFEPTIL